MAYFTKADVKTLIGKTGTDDDAFIDTLILQVTAEVDRRTGRIFQEPAAANLGHHAENDVDGKILFLKTWATDIVTVTNGDGVAVASGERVLVGEGPQNAKPFYEIHLKDDSGISWQPGDSPEEAIVINAKWAYSTTPPLDLKGAMVRLCAYYLRTRKEKTDKLPIWVYQMIDSYSAPFKAVY